MTSRLACSPTSKTRVKTQDRTRITSRSQRVHRQSRALLAIILSNEASSSLLSNRSLSQVRNRTLSSLSCKRYSPSRSQSLQSQRALPSKHRSSSCRRRTINRSCLSLRKNASSGVIRATQLRRSLPACLSCSHHHACVYKKSKRTI